MSLVVRRILANRKKALEEVGLLPVADDGYRAHYALPKITWPHHKPGTKVQLIATKAPWRYKVKTGAVGIVKKIAQACSPEKNPENDLYILDVEGKQVYAKYSELKPA